MRFGTPGYMAPEILNPQLKLPITEKIDVFSCGVVFYQM
jgi:serine/threonine protein kinase